MLEVGGTRSRHDLSEEWSIEPFNDPVSLHFNMLDNLTLSITHS